MRILIQLSTEATGERRRVLAASPDAFTDIAAETVALAIWPNVAPAEAIDLIDADGDYLYTFVGDPR